MSPWEEELTHCQLSLGLSHWDVCLKIGRMLERQQLAFSCQQVSLINGVSLCQLAIMTIERTQMSQPDPRP